MFKTGVIPALLIILPLSIILLVLLIEGDGTATGQISLAVKYSLTVMGLIMSIATLWAGCAAIAKEIEDKQLRLIAVKPVRKYEIWLGRWLGWLAINSGLLIVCGLTILIALQVDMKRQNLSQQTKADIYKNILTGRLKITPEHIPLQKEMATLIKNLKQEGEIPENISKQEAYNIALKQLMAKRTIVAPAAKKEWTLKLPANIPENKQANIKIALKSPIRDGKPTRGTLTVTVPDSPTPILTKKIYEKYNATLFIPLPVEKLKKQQRITITFNNDDNKRSHTLVFPEKKSVELLIEHSNFINNLIRGMIIILCFLALLSALGITASSIFSFPVATFIAIAVIIATITGHYFVFISAPINAIKYEHHHDGEETPPGILEKTGVFFITKLKFIFEPVMHFNVTQNLSSGILITGGEIRRAIILMLFIYSGISGIIGSYVLSRRELSALN